MQGDQLARELTSSLHTDLLSQDRPHGELESHPSRREHADRAASQSTPSGRYRARGARQFFSISAPRSNNRRTRFTISCKACTAGK